MKRALCAHHPNPDIFFPGQGQSAVRNEAKTICLRCPVQTECHQASIDQGERYGIWAGNTKKQYRKD